MDENKINVEWCNITPLGIKFSKYLITNSQFEIFYNSENGWKNDIWWEDLALINKRWDREYSNFKYPVESVNWYTAVAFSRWLSNKLDSKIRLPSKKEWLEAARPNEGNKYPWGDLWDNSMSNSLESKSMHPTEVDIYPKGISKYGVYDMLGNVSEWCLNEVDDCIDMSSGAWELIIGGSFVENCKKGIGIHRYGSAINTYTNCGIRLVEVY